MNDETWLPVIGYESAYQVSNLGRVKSVPRKISVKEGVRGGRRSVKGRILKAAESNGYQSVSLCKGGRVESRFVHDLVLTSFVGPRPEGFVCRHFPDRDRNNNSSINLSWGTPSENQRDRFYHGTDDTGKAKPRKLDPELEKKVRAEYGIHARYKKGAVTQRSLAEKYGVSLSLINFIVRNIKRSGD